MTARGSIQTVDDLLTTKQLQDLLQVDRVTIYRMLKARRLEGFKVGGQWRFSRQTILRWLREKQAAGDRLASPERPDWATGSPLSSSSCMQTIMDIFADAMGVGSVVTAAQGIPLTAVSHPCPFCQMILSTEQGRQSCIGSWSQSSSTAHAISLSPTACHAGVNYLSSPIQVQGEVVAFVHAGQFLAGTSEPPLGREGALAELAAAIGFEAEDLARALAGVPRVDRERLQQVSDLLQRVASALAEMAEERLRLVDRLQHIAVISQIP